MWEATIRAGLRVTLGAALGLSLGAGRQPTVLAPWEVAAQQTHQADRKLDRAEDRLDAAQDRAADLQQTRDAAAWQAVSTLPAWIAQGQSDLSSTLVQIDQSIAQLNQLELSRAATASALQNDQASLAAAQQQLQTARSAYARLCDAAATAFQASEPVLQAQADIQTAGAALEQAGDAVLAALAQTQPHQQAAETARQAEMRVQALRNDLHADPAALAAASQQWMNAQNVVAQLENAALDADPQVRAARASLDQARGNLAALEASFQKELAGRADVLAQAAVVQQAELAVDRVGRAIKADESALAGVESSTAQTRGSLDRLNQSASDIRAQISQWQWALTQAQSTAWDTGLRLDAASREVSRAQADRDAAARQLRAQQRVQRQAEAGKPPPAVVMPPLRVGGQPNRSHDDRGHDDGRQRMGPQPAPQNAAADKQAAEARAAAQKAAKQQKEQAEKQAAAEAKAKKQADQQAKRQAQAAKEQAEAAQRQQKQQAEAAQRQAKQAQERQEQQQRAQARQQAEAARKAQEQQRQQEKQQQQQQQAEARRQQQAQAQADRQQREQAKQDESNGNKRKGH